MTDHAAYCAACAGHGTSVHDPGCTVTDHFAVIRDALRTPSAPCSDCTHDHCLCEERKSKGNAALAALEANLAATEEALLDATDQIEDVRALCREQIQEWRAAERSWNWIKAQPTWRAFVRVGGS